MAARDPEARRHRPAMPAADLVASSRLMAEDEGTPVPRGGGR